MKPIKQEYYIYGLRPVFKEEYETYEIYYAYQRDTGEFKRDMTYGSKIAYDPSGDLEIVTKEAFDEYVEKRKKNRWIHLIVRKKD